MDVTVDSWAWLPKKDLTFSQLHMLKKTLTVIPRKMVAQQEEEPKPVYLFQETPTHIAIAREYFNEHRRPDHKVTLNTTLGNSQAPSMGRFTGVLRAEQQMAIETLRAAFHSGRMGGILRAVPGFGKCLHPETPVLRFDGSVVLAKELRVGDVLMGPDSTPRKILSTTRGEGPRYRIVPTQGESWVCNDAHILTLVSTDTGEVRDVAVEDYLRESESSRFRWKQFQPEHGIDFAAQEPLPLDPYFLGVWFGDGTKALNGVSISKPDPEIRALCEEMATQFGLHVGVDASGPCPTYRISRTGPGENPLLTLLRSVVGLNCTVPRSYLTASRADRKAFLAGFLDTDGFLIKGCYEIAQKRKDYIDAIAFVARSLGYRATLKQKVVNGETYWLAFLSGDFADLPMRLPRKKAQPRKQIKRVCRTGIRVEPYPYGLYYGFTLDGDGRFLLGDFTVTHNTVCGCALMAALDVPTIVLVHKEFLLNQWMERIQTFLPDALIGRAQQDECSYEGKAIVLGMIHSVGSGRYPQEFYDYFGMLIADEAHHLGAQTFSQAPPRFRARYRVALTATPRRKDGAENAFLYHIGPVLFTSKEQRLKFKVKRVWTKFHLVKTERFNPSLAPRTLVITFLCASEFRNRVIVDQLIAALQAGRKVIVLSERLKHLEKLNHFLHDMWPANSPRPKVGFYVGGKKEEELDEARTANVVFATVQFASEGLDIPELDTLFLTTPISDVEQAVGRILRPHEKKKEPVVVDFRDDAVMILKKQGEKRDKYYDAHC